MEYIKDFITNQYLSKLDNMNISISDIIDNFYAGLRKSNKTGMSLEFSDYKQYITGDDIRHIDWNNYAHSDKLYIKRFNEDKQANINIFLDLSKSMSLYNKGYYAKIIAASLAYISLKASDSVRVYICDEDSAKNQISANNKNSFKELINFLDNIEYKENTNLSKTIFNILKINNVKKGISFFISDFFSEDGYEQAIKALKYKKQKIVAIHILSPQELNPDYSQNIRFIDSESGKQCDVFVDEYIVNQYLQLLKSFKDSLKDFCFSMGVAYKLISIDNSFLKELYKIV